MTDLDTITRLYRAAQAGQHISPFMSPYRAQLACYYARLWARVGGAQAALRWLRGVLDE